MSQRFAPLDHGAGEWPDGVSITGRAGSVAAAADEKVCIALSTHDGHSYLGAQLESILAQTHDNWTILWRDDGSADDTPALMRAFAAAHGARRVVEADHKRGRLGITGSFMALVSHAPPGQILAFADQDDVWLPGKLARGVEALRHVNPEQPALYCSRQFLVDSSLRSLGESVPIPRPGGFPQSLTQNIATGCTVMLNPAAVRLLAAMRAPEHTLHDWWAYIVVTAAGGEVLIDDTPGVLYRQHQDNAVGVELSFWPRAFAALRRGPGAFMGTFRAHIAALEEQHDLLHPDAQETLAEISLALRGGWLRRLQALRLPGFYRQTFAETQLFRIWFLMG